METSLPGLSDRERRSTATTPHPRPLILRLTAWCIAAVWRTCVDWRDRRSLLVRGTAHLTIIALALAAVSVSGVAIRPAQILAGRSRNSSGGPLTTDFSVGEAASSPSPVIGLNADQSRSTQTDTISRQAIPHTTFPDRPRSDVITYTVKQDDTIFTIAYQFGLAPETIAWSNREAIQDAPWLIQPGLQLFILPADGIYHTVRAGETAEGIAVAYDVDPSALYNEWNELEEGQPLREGQLLVVPGGTSEAVAWNPPEPEPTQPRYDYQYSASSVAAPSANNWFILPTGGRRVSGWYFHDPRNPTHIGLDYKCHVGNPLYAADNGAVTIAGWHGGYGILVEINHGNGFTTRYGHLSQLATGGGQPIHQGDIIGYCGTTGWSTGAHLHFEIRWNGVPQDPMAYQP